jgi:hypothetical protein
MRKIQGKNVQLTKSQLKNLVENLVDESLHPPDPTGEEVVKFFVSQGLNPKVADAVTRVLRVTDAKEIIRRFSQ